MSTFQDLESKSQSKKEWGEIRSETLSSYFIMEGVQIQPWLCSRQRDCLPAKSFVHLNNAEY